VEAMRIIQNLSGQRLDPRAVAALLAVFQRGEIRIQRSLTIPMDLPALPPAPVSLQPVDPLTVEITRT
jgi:hypothetical protein